jgi:hypothetical protein
MKDIMAEVMQPACLAQLLHGNASALLAPVAHNPQAGELTRACQLRMQPEMHLSWASVHLVAVSWCGLGRGALRPVLMKSAHWAWVEIWSAHAGGRGGCAYVPAPRAHTRVGHRGGADNRGRGWGCRGTSGSWGGGRQAWPGGFAGEHTAVDGRGCPVL